MYCADPVTLAEASCDTPGVYLVMTQAELTQHSPFYLDNESAVQLTAALLFILSVAFVLRMIRKAVEDSEGNEK